MVYLPTRRQVRGGQKLFEPLMSKLLPNALTNVMDESSPQSLNRLVTVTSALLDS